MRTLPTLVRRAVPFVLLALAAPAALSAQAKADTAVKITFGGFADGYYAWDFGQPVDFDRSFFSGALFTTQPTRHNEFNVNLAFIEAKVEGDRIHARLALQAGTSVQSNYLGEPTIGIVSGPNLSRHLQEAYAGTRIGENVWVDAGIFFSNMGMESWISRDNPTYTRSLVAEYSPYYSSGMRGIWQATPKLVVRLDIVNGWQNISESNTGKAAGIRLDYAPNASSAVSYYNLFSDESGNLLRTFNGIGAKVVKGDLTFLGEADFGTQDRTDPLDAASWYGLLAIARYQVTPLVGISGRLERYDDEDQAIVGTGLVNNPLQANGGSIGIDVSPTPRVLFRLEGRGWGNESAVFQDHKGTTPRKAGGFVVSSLALSF